MSWISLLWKRRWVVLLGALVSVVVAIPSLSSTPKGYTSEGEVYIPNLDPVADVSSRDTSSSTVILASYGGGELDADVRDKLGSVGPELVSVSASQDRDLAFFTVSAEARSPEVAREAVSLGSTALIEESDALVEEQIQQLSDRVTAELQPLQEEQAMLEASLREVEVDTDALEERIDTLEADVLSGDRVDALRDRLQDREIRASRLNSQIDVLEAERLGFADLIRSANSTRVVRAATSRVIGGPSTPETTRTEHIIQTVALALLVGLVVAALIIMWLDRRLLVPSEREMDEAEGIRFASENGRYQDGSPVHQVTDPASVETESAGMIPVTSTSSSRRVLLLGLDGLSSSFMAAPLVAASTPNLRALLEESSTGSLFSTMPAYTGPAWTTITTGVNPGRHGVFGFTDGDGRPISDARVAWPRVWDHVGEAGGRSIVVNVPITYPPRAVDGLFVSGMPTPPVSAFTHPVELQGRLEPFEYVVDVAVQEGAREGAKTLDRLAHMTEARGRAAAWLARTEPWDLFAIVFVLPDRLGHPWWKWLVPGHRMYESRAGERIRRQARASLVALDDAIGELLSSVPADTAIVTCSDHGFGPLRADLFFDVALASEGIINVSPSRSVGRAVARVGRSRMSALAPRALHRWAKSKASGGPGPMARRAWTTPPYESGVRLADASDRALQEEVVALLESMREPSGAPIMRAVRRREEIYEGPLTDLAPELLCEMADESVGLHDGLHAAQPWVSRDKTAWGTHAAEGIVALRGAGTLPSERSEAADIAPTILTLLGLKTPGLDGDSLVGGGAGDRVVGAKVRQERSEESSVYSADQEAAVLEHLRGLGYVD
ncbi:MAG: alkaline phosphatase family protein [Actinomycetota bacterium]